MSDYRKLNATHHLSSYLVKIPNWHGTEHTRAPFSSWTTGAGLDWYSAYNAVKHNRHNQFVQANFENLLSAFSGLAALLASQFGNEDFGPSSRLIAMEGGPAEGFEDSIGGFFAVKYPDDWPLKKRDEFDWQKLRPEPDPFRTLRSVGAV